MPKNAAKSYFFAGADRTKIVVLAYDGVSVFELGLAVEIFSVSNFQRQLYRVTVCAERPAMPVSAGMVGVVADNGFDAMLDAGTIVVPGLIDIDAEPSKVVLNFLKRAHASGRRIVSICSGVFLLAAAGLLDGRRAAVHWAQARTLRERYPGISVDHDVLYVDEGNILTSAGRAAGLDLCLHIIRSDHGSAIARAVAQRMVIPVHREGGQAQYIPRSVQTQLDGMVDLCAWLKVNLDRKLSVDDMAKHMRMCRRTFIRRFGEATGLPPGEWLTRQRIERACDLLRDTVMPVEHVAYQVGFSSPEALRHHFRQRYGTSPKKFRRLEQIQASTSARDRTSSSYDTNSYSGSCV